MKKLAVVVVGALVAITLRSQAAQVTLSLEVGQLLTSGAVAIPDGSLIQILADTSSTFSAPTASSYTGNDPNETVLASFSLNSSTIGVTGDFFQPQGPFTLSGNGTLPDVGDFLMLRWYPTLSGTNPGTGPGSGTSYGQFRTNSVENGSDIAWVMPASGTKALNFLTVSQGGTEPNSAGMANLTVAAVPEPATSSLLIGAFAFAALVWRKTRQPRS